MKPAVVIVRDDCLSPIQNTTAGHQQDRIIEAFILKCVKLAIPIISIRSIFHNEKHFTNERNGKHRERSGNICPDNEPEKHIVVKQSGLSAFCKTDLEQILRNKGIDTVAVGGRNLHLCVLATAFDALSHDFYVVILKDISTTNDKRIDETFIDVYSDSQYYPLLSVQTSDRFLKRSSQGAITGQSLSRELGPLGDTVFGKS